MARAPETEISHFSEELPQNISLLRRLARLLGIIQSGDHSYDLNVTTSNTRPQKHNTTK